MRESAGNYVNSKNNNLYLKIIVEILSYNLIYMIYISTFRLKLWRDMFGLGRKQIDRDLDSLRKLEIVKLGVPSGGWLRSIREALGITLAQLAKRAEVSPQAIIQAESSEHRGTISLKTLESLAESLNCRMVYFILPNTKLENMIETQIQRKAKSMLEHISHSMSL